MSSTDQLTLAEMRERLEDLRGVGLEEVRTRGPYLCLTPQEAEWILDLASAELARREREEVAEAQARYAKCQHVWIEEYYGYKCNGCDSFHAYGTAPWEAPIEQR